MLRIQNSFPLNSIFQILPPKLSLDLSLFFVLLKSQSRDLTLNYQIPVKLPSKYMKCTYPESTADEEGSNSYAQL